MKRVVILGVTGSIGQQTLDIVKAFPEEFQLVGIAAGSSEEKVRKILEDFPSVEAVSMEQVNSPENFMEKTLYTGTSAMEQMCRDLDYDLLVNATVGFRGLKPTLTAVEKGRDIALANKESLVTGGDLVKAALKTSKSRIFPIDSEHSAIAQCLAGNSARSIDRLIITASGGSLRNRSREELQDVSIQEVLHHPNWNMGARITVDSATMVNKGFEVIEAHYLFDLPYEKIDTVLHDESIIHSMVEFNDHAVMAQLGSPDMHLPIQYAMFENSRQPLDEKQPLDMTKTMSLHFRQMDFERYPILKTAYEVGKKGGNAGAVFNGADEKAVELFLQGKLTFLQIEQAIQYALESVAYLPQASYEQIEKSDRLARDAVEYFAAVESVK